MWYTYIVRCCDNTLYTGLAKDLDQRIAAHNSGRNGAKYTRARRPVRLVYREEFPTRSEAARREYAIKQLDLAAKEQLLAEGGFPPGDP